MDFSFHLSENIFVLPSFWLIMEFFIENFVLTLTMSICYILALVFLMKSPLAFVSPYAMGHFSLAALKIFSLSLVWNGLSMMCRGVILFLVY